MSVSLLTLQVEKARIASRSQVEDKDQSDSEGPSVSNPTFTDSQGRHHEGALKIDATCADAQVRYPTDIGLPHDGCKVINRYINTLCRGFSLVHPTTCYKSARAVYLEVIKRKKKSKCRSCNLNLPLIKMSSLHCITVIW